MTITSVPNRPGRAWGVAALVAVALPLPCLFALNILSLVVRGSAQPGGAEAVIYGILAAVGLFFFPLFFIVGLAFAITAVTKPRPAGKVMGWIAISIVILAIPLIWTGYLVWISPA